MAPTMQAPPIKMPQLHSSVHDRRPDTASGSSAIISQGISLKTHFFCYV